MDKRRGCTKVQLFSLSKLIRYQHDFTFPIGAIPVYREAMKKNTETQRRHKAYLRAKNALRDQHQDDYALMLERHAQELDTLWADYNFAVRKLADAHNKAIKSKIVPMNKGRVSGVESEEQAVH